MTASDRMCHGVDCTWADPDRQPKPGERSAEEILCVEHARALRRILAAVARIAATTPRLGLSDKARAMGAVIHLSETASIDLDVAALSAEEAAAEYEALANPTHDRSPA